MHGLGCASINFNNKARRPVPTIHIYTVNRNRVDLCLQGSSNLRMCSSQTDQNTARIWTIWFSDHLYYLSHIWCEYDVICFDVWCVFCCRGMHIYQGMHLYKDIFGNIHLATSVQLIGTKLLKLHHVLRFQLCQMFKEFLIKLDSYYIYIKQLHVHYVIT